MNGTDGEARETLVPAWVLSPQGELLEGTFLQCWETEEGPSLVRLTLRIGSREITSTSENFFHAIQAIRLELEKEGMLLWCYGASRNVHPSGVILSMGYGAQAYKHTYGQPALKKDLVDIFDDGPDVDPVTVAEQEAFYDEWFDYFRQRLSARQDGSAPEKTCAPLTMTS